MVPLGITTKGLENLPAFWEIDVLPAEEAGIDGPGARSDHRQHGTEDRLRYESPWIARMREIPRESDPHFSDGRQRSRHRGPQTDQKKYPRNGSTDLQDRRHQRRCFKKVGDPKMDERNARKHPQEQKT